MCGSGVTRGCVRSGESSGSGSVANTSSPAARRRPLSSAASSASSCTVAPRAAVDEDRARLHRGERRASIRPRVLVGQRQHRDHEVGAAPAARRAACGWRALQFGRLRREVDRPARVVEHRHAEAQRRAARDAPGRCGRSRGGPASCRARPQPNRSSPMLLRPAALAHEVATARRRGGWSPSAARRPCRRRSRRARPACGTAGCRARAARRGRSCRRRPRRWRSTSSRGARASSASSIG